MHCAIHEYMSLIKSLTCTCTCSVSGCHTSTREDKEQRSSCWSSLCGTRTSWLVISLYHYYFLNYFFKIIIIIILLAEGPMRTSADIYAFGICALEVRSSVYSSKF